MAKYLSGNASQRRKAGRKIVQTIKNKILHDKICGTGLFWCNHLFEPEYKSYWADFKFLSQKTPSKLFYSGTIDTLAHSVYCDLREVAADKAVKFLGEYTGPSFLDNITGQSMRTTFSEEELKYYEKLRALEDEYLEETIHTVHVVQPSINIVQYPDRPFCKNVFIKADVPFINNDIIGEFIEQHRHLIETSDYGTTWYGEKIEIKPWEFRNKNV